MYITYHNRRPHRLGFQLRMCHAGLLKLQQHALTTALAPIPPVALLHTERVVTVTGSWPTCYSYECRNHFPGSRCDLRQFLKLQHMADCLRADS